MKRVLSHGVQMMSLALKLTRSGLLLLPLSIVHATELGDLANSMKPGEWRELTTNNIDSTLLAGGASGIVFGYTEDIKWDPISRQLLYLGGDHFGGPAVFVKYRESTNTWQRPPQPSWIGTRSFHGYDHNAIDPVARVFFHRPYLRRELHIYQIDTETWTTGADIPGSVMAYNACCAGVEWFPELSALIYTSVESGSNGALAKYKAANDQWSRITGPELPMGKAHHFAEYNPVHKVAIFGGGDDGYRDLYKVDVNENVSALARPPVDLGIQASIVTVDPVSGDYLVFTRGHQFYVYNVLGDEWQAQSGAANLPIWTTRYSNPVHGVVATPVSSYNVNLFVTCQNDRGCQVHLYKHAPGNVASPPDSPTDLTAN